MDPVTQTLLTIAGCLAVWLGRILAQRRGGQSPTLSPGTPRVQRGTPGSRSAVTGPVGEGTPRGCRWCRKPIPSGRFCSGPCKAAALSAWGPALKPAGDRPGTAPAPTIPGPVVPPTLPVAAIPVDAPEVKGAVKTGGGAPGGEATPGSPVVRHVDGTPDKVPAGGKPCRRCDRPLSWPGITPRATVCRGGECAKTAHAVTQAARRGEGTIGVKAAARAAKRLAALKAGAPATADAAGRKGGDTLN